MNNALQTPSFKPVLGKTLLAGLTALLLATAGSLSAQGVDNGKMAPEFSLSGHDGKTYKLSDFKGKHVVLEWYNKDCPYVRKHYDGKNMQALQKQFGSKGVVWFSVISSAPGKQGHLTAAQAKAQLAQEKASPKAILLDPTGKVGKLYNAKTTPHMYIVNPKGQLVFQGGIDDQPSASQGSLKTAKPLFANALTAVLSGKSPQVAQVKPYGCSVKYGS